VIAAARRSDHRPSRQWKAVAALDGLVAAHLFCCRSRRSYSEYVGVQELVPKLALWVELFGQGYELGEFFVAGVELLRGHGEEFAPVGAGLKGGEFFFDDGEELADGGPVLLPGEVDGDAGLLVAGAHPEVVGGDGANFGDEEMRGDLVAEAFDGEDGFDGVLARDEIFGLQLFAGTGREAHAEVREAFVPGAEDAHLLGAVFGGERGDGMEIFGGQLGAEEFGLGVEGLTLFDAAF
jgi:hypothetical protein